MSNRLLHHSILQKLGILLIGCCALLPSRLIGQNIDALDAQGGFFDLVLGSDISTFNNIDKKGSQLKRDRYRWKTCPRTYAGVRISGVELYFYKSRLHSLVISIQGETDSKAFLELLTMYYGPGTQLGMAPHFTWSGKQVRLVYEQNLFSKNTLIVFESVEVQLIYSQDYRIN